MNKVINILKLTIVNALTLSRLFGAFALPFIYIKYSINFCSFIILILFLTDALDGFLARTLHCSTFFGCSMDALSDKLLSSISFILLALTYRIMIIPIILEITIFMINFSIYKNGGNVQSSKTGKIKTIILDTCIILSFFLIGVKLFNISNSNITYLINNTSYIINILGCICSISGIIALNDYKKKYIITRKIPNNIKINYKNLKKKTIQDILRDLFDTSYYLKHKDESITKQFYK